MSKKELRRLEAERKQAMLDSIKEKGRGQCDKCEGTGFIDIIPRSRRSRESGRQIGNLICYPCNGSGYQTMRDVLRNEAYQARRKAPSDKAVVGKLLGLKRK